MNVIFVGQEEGCLPELPSAWSVSRFVDCETAVDALSTFRFDMVFIDIDSMNEKLLLNGVMSLVDDDVFPVVVRIPKEKDGVLDLAIKEFVMDKKWQRLETSDFVSDFWKTVSRSVVSLSAKKVLFDKVAFMEMFPARCESDEVLLSFLSEAGWILERMERGLPLDIVREVHRLKGLSLTVFASRLFFLAYCADRFVKNGWSANELIPELVSAGKETFVELGKGLDE